MILYCVRHGESQFNAQGRIQGQTDTPLSPLGVRQSEALARELAGYPVQAVYSSPLRRALETAQPIAAALGQEVRTDARLMEINAGIFQGLDWSQIEQQYPDEARRWKSFDPDFVIPGGESRRSLMQRGRQALEAIREAGWSQAVVVAHGGLLAAAIKALLDIPAQRNPISLFNGSISVLRWSSEVKLVVLNRIDHLRDVEGGAGPNTGDL